ncbi:YcnI family protein [Bdellovibrio sp. HCB117]|uniref:YcnI family copper-binding membrane protein n=1 Tax=Bdellovibrio sp. HCB117 TaxID=3394359 RepID=UPI0039B646C5
MFKSFLFLSTIIASISAHGHVSFEVPSAAAGSYYKAVARVPHGCEGSPTTAVHISIPKGFVTPKPMPKPGWNVETVQNDLGQIEEIRFSGGRLADAHYDEFVFRGKIMAAAGSTLYFKVLQTCESGQINWADVPVPGQDEHSLLAPAPSLKITPATGAH